MKMIRFTYKELQNALIRYTSPTQKYDPEFAKKLKSLAPHWFNIRGKPTDYKNKILKLTKEGTPIPRKGKIYYAFRRLTYKDSNLYDIDFVKKLENINPDILKRRQLSIEESQKKLLEMAKNNDRPARNHRLAGSLFRYTSKKSKAYDPKFVKELRKIKPEWICRESNPSKNKEKLIGIAKDGKKLPIRHKLYALFFNYTIESSECYDPEFTEKIKEIRPDWFKSRNKTNLVKTELLRLARSNLSRISSGTIIKSDLLEIAYGTSLNYIDNYIDRLQNALIRYTNPNSKQYDPEFTKELNKINPGWVWVNPRKSA